MEIKPILLVDDNSLDAAAIGQVFKQAGVENPLVHLPSGEDAIEYLLGTGHFQDRKQFPFPCLMLLDLKMPGISGFEVLQWRSGQTHSEIKLLPVIVLTVHHDMESVRKAYSLGASSFVTKPLKIDEVTNMLPTISHLLASKNLSD